MLESIDSYKDVNELLKNYKLYFDYVTILPIGCNYVFEFEKIKDVRTLFMRISINLYTLSEKSRYAVNDKKEPYIRNYTWENKEYITKELQKRAQIKKLADEEERMKIKLEEEIKSASLLKL